ncbi:venom serine carboxypeptidase-like [Plodia interpunctella]|uniref:venom serine carboxypeptidase-like n=1 Tax=Plodia interpunctella TaxID=58824 RepID=UPI002368DDD7|nr:venom serine carboxypeptidase-like [Plodia interpunctella]
MYRYLVFLQIFLCLYLETTAFVFPYVYPVLKLEASHGDAGKPLMLTPYLKNGSISLAQNLSRVSITEKLGCRSYAGFFTVNETYNSNHYFWYFPPISGDESAPLLLWLQGGPGGSSLFGLFVELGPITANNKGFVMRKHHWALTHHLLFIDNPVGAGFSFTDQEKGYCTNEDCISKGLYNSLQQFFTLFPKLRNNDFFITGESYAGKYIPALAMMIHKQNENCNEKKIELKGLAIGNGYCDPVNQLDYGNYLYQHGLIDNAQLRIFQKYQSKIYVAIKNENWGQADLLMDYLLDGDIANTSYFGACTGFENYYNFLQPVDNLDVKPLLKLLQKDDVRRSVHVGNRPFNAESQNVALYLSTELLKSVAPYIAELLSTYRIMFYNGQLDIIVAYPLTVNFLKNLNFSSAHEYRNAPRKIWRVKNEIAGYVKKAGNLTEVLVRNAGHMVPHDQPKWALDLITRFVNGKL